MVLDLIRRIGTGHCRVVMLSQDTPHVFEIADRIHVHRLGPRVAVVSPQERTMTEVVPLMTGTHP
jgi:fructose transport system ATP-binding protein